MQIDTSELPGNSNLAKSEETREIRSQDAIPSRKVVAKGEIHKKSTFSKLSDIFQPKDIRSVAIDVFERLIVPNGKALLVDTINSVARGVILGEGAEDYKSSSKNPTGYVSYQGYYSNGRTKAAEISNHKTDGRFQFDEITYDDYGKAQYVLDQMDECIQDGGYVTVADMYSMSGMTCPFTGNYWGWTNISKAKIVPDHGRWWLKMPPAIQIRRDR